VYDLILYDEMKLLPSGAKRNTLIAFSYDSSVNNGGHILFFDLYGEIFSVDEVANALYEIGGEKFSLNFLSAASHIHYTEEFGYMPVEESDPAEDFVYYGMNPSLSDLMEAYIFNHKETIFN